MLTREEIFGNVSSRSTEQDNNQRLLDFFNQLALYHRFELRDWCDAILEFIAQEIGALQGVFYTADHQANMLFLTGSFSIRSEQKPPYEVQWGDGLIGMCAQTQHMKRIEANTSHTHYSGLSCIQPKELLLIPLVFNQVSYGVLKFSHLHGFTQSDITFLQSVIPLLGAQVMARIKAKEQEELTRRLQEREEKLLRIAEVSNEGILFVDLYNIITEANIAAKRLLGYSDDELQGLRLQDIFQIQKTMAELTSAADIPACETFATCKNGCRLAVEIQAKRVNYNGRLLQVISFRDISARLETRLQLEKAQAELDYVQEIIALNEQLEEQNRKIISSINYARRIQNALLPSTSEMLKAFPQHFLLFLPRDIVSGDFYWLSRQQNCIFIALADCTGHGVPGALMSMVGMEMLSRIINEQRETSPAAILTRLDSLLQGALHQEDGSLNDGMDIGICAFHQTSNKIYYAGAKHDLLLFSKGKGKVIPADRRSIGSRKHNKEPFTEHVIEVTPDTMLYMLSDGYADQFGGEHNRKIGSKQLEALLAKIHALDCTTQKNILTSFLTKWRGNNRQIDDISVLGIRL